MQFGGQKNSDCSDQPFLESTHTPSPTEECPLVVRSCAGWRLLSDRDPYRGPPDESPKWGMTIPPVADYTEAKPECDSPQMGNVREMTC
jgi:hypothetical protein